VNHRPQLRIALARHCPEGFKTIMQVVVRVVLVVHVEVPVIIVVVVDVEVDAQSVTGPPSPLELACISSGGHPFTAPLMSCTRIFICKESTVASLAKLTNEVFSNPSWRYLFRGSW